MTTIYTRPAARSGTDRRAQFASSRSAARKSAAVSSRRLIQFPMWSSNKRAAEVEVKFFDTDLNFPIDATGEVPATGQLSLIPQGDTGSTRDGRQCVIKSIQIKGIVIFTPAAAATAASIGYLALILDKQCNGAPAAVTDVFTSTNMATNLINLNNSERFMTLKKWKFNMTAQAGVTAAYNESVRAIDFFKKCNIPMNFSSTTGAITEIRSNNVFLIAGSSNSDDLITLVGTCRLRFTG